MTGNFIDLIFSERIPLWRDARHQHSVTLAYPRKDQEGDLSLEFNLKGTPLCNLSFTFIHGGKLGLPERTVLFVSRLQGSPGMFDVMRETTKQLNDVSIFSILLTSAQAIARTLDVSITAITAQSQTVVGKLHNGSTHKHRYDTMWESFGGERANETFYTLPVNPFSKPLAMTSKNHRAKRVKQRDFKRSIFNKTIESFSSHCILPCRRFIVNDSNTM